MPNPLVILCYEWFTEESEALSTKAHAYRLDIREFDIVSPRLANRRKPIGVIRLGYLGRRVVRTLAGRQTSTVAREKDDGRKR